MPHKKRNPKATHVGTKLPRVSPKGSPLRRGGNPGGTNEAGNNRVGGNSHQGSSLGKRNSG